MWAGCALFFVKTGAMMKGDHLSWTRCEYTRVLWLAIECCLISFYRFPNDMLRDLIGKQIRPPDPSCEKCNRGCIFFVLVVVESLRPTYLQIHH
jgi:hypothetical protein